MLWMLPYLDNLGLHLLVFVSYLDRYYTQNLLWDILFRLFGSILAENQLLYGTHMI